MSCKNRLLAFKDPMMPHEVNPYQAASPANVDENSSGPPPTMAEYMLDADDIVALSLHTPATRRQFRTIRLALLFGLVVLGVLTFWRSAFGQGGAKGEPGMLAPFVVFLVTSAGIVVWLSPPVVRRRIRRSCAKVYPGKLPWPQTITLSSEGMLVTTPQAEGRHHWDGIDSIDTTKTHAFFYMSKLHAVIVPARAFRNEAQFQAFVALARELWNRARSP